MKINFHGSKTAASGRDVATLRLTCLLGLVLSLIIPLIWVHTHATQGLYSPVASIFSLFFISVVLLSYVNKFMQRHAAGILYGVCFLSSAVALYFAYKSSFPEIYMWILVFIVLIIILITNNIYNLVIYLGSISCATVILLYMVEDPLINRLNTSFFFVMICLAAFINMRVRLSSQEALNDMAYNDAITGLPNRNILDDYLSNQLMFCKINNIKLAVMFIDLDRFKLINDSLGHRYGDMVLQQCAGRLKKCLRKGDLVLRYGGDEFVIILNGILHDEVIQLAHRIQSSFCQPFKIKDHEVFSSPSIGISFYPEDGKDAEELIKNADAAMYLAKDKGRNNYQFYTTQLNKAVSRKMALENALRKALDKNELVLHYQPQFDLDSGAIAGVEALIRWQHPSLGLVSPLELIPLAEETGLIISIGQWVMETACRQNKAWQDAGFPKIPVAVNVSGYQLQNSDFINTVKDVLSKTGLEPEYLVVEMTESIMQDTPDTPKIVDRLRSFGIKVAIDDFGTGYSSFSLLKNLNLDILKIDPSFTRDIITSADTYIIIKYIINMAHELDFNIVAEGIEDEEQAQLLRRHRCDFGQGYLFSRPLPCVGIEDVLRSSVTE